MLWLGWKTLDARRHNAPYPDGLTIFRNDVWVGWVSGFQLESTGIEVELLDCKFTVHHGHHDVLVAGLDRTVDNDHILVVNALIDHGVTRDRQEERCLWVRDEQVVEVHPFFGVVVSW